MILRLAEVTTPRWNSAGPSSWYRKFCRPPVNSPTAPSPMARTSRSLRLRVLSTAAFCKHRASRAFHRIPPQCTAVAQNWLGAGVSVEYDGMRVHNRGGS
jgi:hypothetical protein